MSNNALTGKHTRKPTKKSKTGNENVTPVVEKLSLSGPNNLFRVLVESLNEVVFTVDRDGCFVYVSPVIEKVSGFTPEEVIGSPFIKFIHSDDLPDVLNAYEKALDGADNMSAEFRVFNKYGGIWYAHVSTRLLFVDGEMSGLAGVLTDITERKQTEYALRKSEQEKLAILNAIPDIMFHLDRNGVFLDYKAEKQETLLKSPAEFLGKTVQEVLPEWLSDLTLKHLRAAIKTKKIQVYEYRLEMRDVECYFEARMMPFQDDHVLTIIRDITEQKQAEQAILDAEQKYRALVEQIPAVVYTDSAEKIGKTYYISPQIATILGFDAEEWSKNNDLWISSIYPDDRERVLSEYNRTYESGEPFLTEYRIYSKSRQLIWIRDESVLIRDQSGRPFIWQGIMLDITERKMAETALVESEERYRKMVELSPEAILVHVGGEIFYINQAGLSLLGIKRTEDVVGKPIMDLIHPDTRESAARRINETLKSKNPSKPIKEKMIRMDGSTAEVEMSNMPLVYNGKPAIQIMVRDITSQQLAEEERRLNAQRLETLLRLSQMNTASLEELTDFAMEQAVRLTGSTLGYIAFVNEDESVLTMHAWSSNAMRECKIKDKPIIYPVKDTGLWGEAVRQRKPVITNDYRKPNPKKRGVPDGHVDLTRHLNVPIFDAEHIVIVAGVGNKAAPYNEMDVKQLTLLMDGVWQIIRRKQADDALRESEDKFRNVIEQATEGMVLVNEKGLVIEFNQAIAEMTGIDRNKAIGIPFWELQLNISDKNRSEYFKELVLDALQTGQSSFFNHPVEVTVVRPDGMIRFVEQITFLVKTGKGYQISSLFRDITDRKKADDALRSSEASYRGLFDSVLEAVYILDREGCFLDVNQGAVNMYGYPREFFIGKAPADVSAPGKNDLVMLNSIMKLAFAGEPQKFEFWGRRKNGEVFPKEVRLYAGTYFGKDILFALAQDITDRKRNEDAVQRRDAILEAVGFASEQFLKSPDWRQSIQAVVERLGQTADASRAYIFENFTDPEGDLLLRQIYEWSAEGVLPQLNNKVLQHISYRKDGFLRWRKKLQENQIVSGHVSAFPSTEQKILVPQGIVSLIVMPIFVGSKWWGFIGFDECRYERVWHPTEIEALRTAASLMGAAIQKMESEEARQQQLQELEVLHAISLACMKAAIIDQLIENVTHIVIDAFHLDSFGVMLFDPKKQVLKIHPSYHGEFKKNSLEQIPLGKGVTGYVAETRLPYRVDDVRKEKRYLKVNPGMHSELCVPVLAGDKLIGVLNAESRQLNFFNSNTERLFSTISVTMATAMEKLSLFEAEYIHRQEAEKLRDASTALTSSLELQPLLDNILESLVKIVPHDSASIVLREKNGLRIVAAHGIPETVKYFGQVFPLNKKWETIIETRQVLILEDAQKSPDFEKWAGSDYIHGWMGIPLLVRGELIGCLCLDSQKTNAFTQEHASMAQTYANHAASAIENAHLFSAEREQRYRQDAMVDLMKIAALSLDLDTVLENTLVYLLRLIPGKTGSIQLLEGDQLRVAAEIGFVEGPIRTGVRFPLNEYPLNQQIIREKCAICLGDTWQDNRYIRLPTSEKLSSFMGVPLVFKEKAIGIITLDSDQYNGFSEQDVEIAFAVARNISMAVENARLFELERTRYREAETLRQATAAIASSLNWENAIHLILEQLAKVVPYDSASVQLLRDGYLEIVGGQGWPDTQSVLGMRFPIPGDNPNTVVIQTLQPLVLGNAPSRFMPFLDGVHSHIISWLGVPMVVHDRVIGMLAVDSVEPSHFTEESVRLVSAFASQSAIAIENARLYEQAVKAAERRAILHQASEEIARSSQDPEKVYEAVHRAAERLMPAEAFVISLLDETRNEICSVYLYDKDGRWPVMYASLDSGISGEIISTGKATVIQDLEDLPVVNAVHFGSEDEVRSVLAVPMRLGDKVIGMLSAQSYRPNIYTEEDQRLLEMLAAHAVVAIENARLFDQTQRRRLEAEALRDATTVLTSSLDGDEVMKHLLDALANIIPYDSATVFLHDGESLIGKVARGLPFPEKVIGQKFSVSDALFQIILKTRTPLVIPDVHKDPRFQYFGETTYLHGWMGIPLIIRDEVIGILTIDSSSPDAYTESHAELALAFANQAATAVEKARLFQEILHRLSELEVVNRVSTQLRTATTVGEMLPCLLDEALHVLNTDSGSIWLYDTASGLLKTPLARGWFMQLGETPMKPGEGIAGRVFSTGKTIISREFFEDPLPRESVRSRIPSGWGGGCVPIRSGQETIGVMFIAVALPRELQEGDIHLLTTLCEIAGNAIRRADLHEQTERQLQRLASLRTIDMAISTILDLRVTLGILIDHILSQLRVDAVNVLLINPNTQTLYHAASSGFRSDAVRNSQVYINDGLALQAIRSRSTVFIPNLVEANAFPRLQLLTGEGFVTYFGVPLIAKGQVKGILETFHRHPEDPDMDWRGFLETLAGQAAIAIDNSLLFEELQQTNLNLSLAYDATIEGWSKALDLRDQETEGHTLRVTEMTLQLADAMGINAGNLVDIRRGALLHDIGKMGVPDSILHKAGPLTEEEWAVMHRHPEFAYAMLSPITYLRPALDVPYCHHERWDGSGYPRALKEDQIPLAARLFAVVDVWDALTSTRPYRKGWTKKDATEFIRKNSGILFDPKVVETFLTMLSKNGTGR